VWFAQLQLNFRIYYLFPYAAYFLIKAFLTKRPHFLWLTGITLLFWWQGSGYFFFLWIFVFAVMLVILFMQEKWRWRWILEYSLANILTLGLMSMLLIGYGLYAKALFNNIQSVTVSRSSSGGVGLNTFLTYGGLPSDIPVILKSLFFAIPLHLPMGCGWDNTVYCGVLILAFFAWAILRVRRSDFFLFLALAITLVWLSFGGLFSAIVYNFPPMRFYRHIGLVYGFVKIIVILCAGFGLENFWQSNFKTRYKTFTMITLAGFFLVDMGQPGIPFRLRFICNVAIYLIVFLGVILFKNHSRKKDYLLGGIFIFALTVDLLLFQSLVFSIFPRLGSEYSPLLETTQVREMQYQPKRLQSPSETNQINANKLITNPYSIVNYSFSYNFTQFDPCISSFRTDFLTPGFLRLANATVLNPRDVGDIIGCNCDKARIISNAVFCKNDSNALSKMASQKDLSNTVVLTGETSPETQWLQTKDSAAATAKTGSSVSVTRFSANEVRFIAKPGNDHSWLVYADAYDPGWKAEVNGKKARVYRAFLAFKAVHLDKGANEVRFFFDNAWGSSLNRLVISFSVLGSAGMLFWVVCILFSIGRCEMNDLTQRDD
jgi:hypothetical protein